MKKDIKQYQEDIKAGVDVSGGWKDQLQDEFMDFWDKHSPTVGLGDYSDEITRFWFEKLDAQREKVLDLIVKEINIARTSKAGKTSRLTALYNKISELK
jgi:hypothetical protein